MTTYTFEVYGLQGTVNITDDVDERELSLDVPDAYELPDDSPAAMVYSGEDFVRHLGTTLKSDLLAPLKGSAPPESNEDGFPIAQTFEVAPVETVVDRMERTLEVYDATLDPVDNEDTAEPDETDGAKSANALDFSYGTDWFVQTDPTKTVNDPSWHRRRNLKEAADRIDFATHGRLQEAFDQQVWPDDVSKAPSWQASDDVTEQTQEWVEVVLDMRDPLFDSYSDIPQAAALRVKGTIQDALTDPSGWSLDGIASDLSDEFDFLERYRAERIARQEVAAVLNEAQSVQLEAAADATGESPSDPIVKWVGPSDGRTTTLCKSVKSAVGDGVPLSELDEILQAQAREYRYGTPDRIEDYVPHYQCRHRLEPVDGVPETLLD